VFRVKYLNDEQSLDEAALQFISWARRSLANREENICNARRHGWKAMNSWINDQCNVCSGLMYKKIEGAPCLSDIQCKACAGTGKKLINDDITKDLIERADAMVLQIHRSIANKLYN